jgi:hypothetical protein
MKITQKLLKLLYVLGLILIITIGYGEIHFYRRFIHRIPKKGEQYLGEVGGRKIYGFYGYFYKDGPYDFAIKVNDEIVYMEMDDNRDGFVDSIIHCEKGKKTYFTSYDPSTRALLNRNVEYYDENGQHKFTVFDKQGDGRFISRIKYLDKGTEVDFEKAKKYIEILVNNKWVKLEKENDSYGFYNDTGEFIPIDWNKGDWKILENKE